MQQQQLSQVSEQESESALQPLRPEADGKITKALLLGCALAEATAIYGFVIGLLIILFLK